MEDNNNSITPEGTKHFKYLSSVFLRSFVTHSYAFSARQIFAQKDGLTGSEFR